MRVNLAFGKAGLALDLPEGFHYRVLEARSAEPLEDAAGAIEQALDHPTSKPPLVDMARGRRTAAISVCDITRPAPNRQVLPPILARLQAPATDAEIREIVGPEIAAWYRVANHHARELSEHTHLGTTASGTPAYIDSRFVSADLHITCGFIEPHLMLGYSGGRKLVAPGLAAQETIKVLHSPKFMRDPRASEGTIEDNPLHRELLEIARMARQDFIVDVALARDRRIAGVFAGHAEEAHREGVRFVSQVMLETLDEPVDAVITTCAGYPLDLTFYQALKGATAASHIVKPGGKILLLAACEEGAGAPEFSRMLKDFPSWREFMDTIARAPVVVDQWQLEKFALVTAKAEVSFYVPGLPAEYHPFLWGKSYPSAAGAVEGLTRSLAPGAKIAVIPEGPYVLAKAGVG